MNYHRVFGLLVSCCSLSAWAAAAQAETVRDIGSRLELFVDTWLVGELQGTTLKLHEPCPAEVVLKFDRPWEGAFCGYVTVFEDGDRYRMYYRGLPVAGHDGSSHETACYAESGDGIHWTKPDLDLFEVHGTRRNNVVLHDAAPATHNFSPLLDQRPGVPADERYKAVGGTKASGLIGFLSGDGVRWRRLRDEPVFRDGYFDSQNVVFWSQVEGRYVCYFRTFSDGIRTISRTTSPDFLDWSEPVEMTFGDAPREHLYTNQTTAYYRAPHIYVAFPMRFVLDCSPLTDEQKQQLGVHPRYAADCADVLFMSTRGGSAYDRTFREAYIRPGSDPGNWASRAGMIAHGIVQTGPAELSIYKQIHYAQPDAGLQRYRLRIDGFTSVNAPAAGGDFVTRRLRFSGTRLFVNFATSAAGSIGVEIQDQHGQPIPGYGLDDAVRLVGDEIERHVTWTKADQVADLEGRVVRLRFVMKDADLYAIRFQ